MIEGPTLKAYAGRSPRAVIPLVGSQYIGRVIEPTWQALLSHHSLLLRSVFDHNGERDKFRLYADRLRERRNYAMHNKTASIDEPWFTYEETGLLLLYAVEYFNQFAELIKAINALP